MKRERSDREEGEIQQRKERVMKGERSRREESEI